MEQITVVIGDRLGKGQKVAAGAEKPVLVLLLYRVLPLI